MKPITTRLLDHYNITDDQMGNLTLDQMIKLGFSYDSVVQMYQHRRPHVEQDIDAQIKRNVLSNDTPQQNNYYSDPLAVLLTKTFTANIATCLIARFHLDDKYTNLPQPTFDQIGKLIGCSGAHAGRLVNKGLRMLRHPSRQSIIDYAKLQSTQCNEDQKHIYLNFCQAINPW